jgi:gamma-glutamyltranspeptidase / glutathione hydrolase
MQPFRPRLSGAGIPGWKGWGSGAIAGLVLFSLSGPAFANTSERQPAARWNQPPSDKGYRGMVTSAHPLASQAGLNMLQTGGNAVDAAVATTLAISVVEPFSAGIGGGGFLLVRDGKTGKVEALDFRERAPLGSSPKLYLDAQGKVRPGVSTEGYLAAGVPGTVAGLYAVHQRYGKLSWQQVVQPAQQMAAAGIQVTPKLAGAIARRPELQADSPEIFKPQGKPLQLGDRLVQTDLASTLQRLATNPQDFYTGITAKAIAQDMQANGGLITAEDLKRYKPIWREPVCGEFRQARVCSMPPPSSGGVHLLQILNLLAPIDLKAKGWRDPEALHSLIESMRIAYRDRAEYLGDPDFVKVPVKQLISPAYANLRRPEIGPRARPSKTVQPGDLKQIKESNDTSHLNTADGEGNVVSLTFTINLGFGAGVVAKGTGVILNNEMDDFALAPGVPNAFGLVGSAANAIAPGKTPLSSMTPTIVTQNGQFRLAAGAPGGSTIITTTLQIVLNTLEYDMDVRRAVAAPRLHHQWLPDQVRLERWGLDPLTRQTLALKGHSFDEQLAWGNASAIERQSDGLLEGAADPRGEGTAYGF